MKNKNIQFTLYRYWNIGTAVICILLMLVDKSEQKNQLIFGFSFRIIVLCTIMFVVAVWFLIAYRFSAKLVRAKKLDSNNTGDSTVHKSPRYGSVWVVILLLVSLVAVFGMLIVPFSPHSDFFAPLSRIIPFEIFGLSFSISTLIYLGTGAMKDKFQHVIDDLYAIIRRPDDLIFIEFIFLAIASLIFAKPISLINIWDTNNGNHFVIVTFWVLLAISGLLVASQLMNYQGSKIIDYLHANNGYQYAALALLTILIFAIGHPVYGSNDDYSMMTIASGQIDGFPDGHLVFTNIIIGTILKSLYNFSSEINWYSLYLILVLEISSFALLSIVVNIFKSGSSRLIALIIFFIFIPRLFYAYNFTAIAMVACFTGITLLVKTTLPGQARASLFEKLLGIALIFVSSLIRFPAMALVGLFTAPAILFIILKERKMNLVLPIGISLLLALGAYFYDIQVYKASPEWSTFRDYNYQRGLIHDTPRLNYDPSQQQFWNQIGWKKSGYDLFEQWFFIDNQVFTLDSLKAVNQEFRYARYSPGEVLNRFFELFARYQTEEVSFLASFVAVFLFLPINSRRAKTFLGLAVIYIGAIITILAFVQRIPDHIYVPTLFISSLYILVAGYLLAKSEVSDAKQTLPLSILQIVLMGALLLQVNIITRVDQVNIANLQTRTELIDVVKDNVGTTPETLVVFQAGSVPDYSVSPFSVEEMPFDALPTGWLINSPPYNHLLKQHNIDNLIDASYSDPNLYFVGDVEDLLINYLQNVKHIDAVGVSVNNVVFPSVIFKVVR